MEGQIGIDVVLWFQSWRTGAIAEAFVPFNWLGGLWFYLLALPLLIWCVDKPLGRRLALVLLLSAWTNAELKSLFSQPRPFEVSALVEPYVKASGGGMPSGHAMLTLVFWGVLAGALRRAWLTVLAGVLVLLVGVSRILHGVHFPGDVLAGWIFAVLIVGAASRGMPLVSGWVATLTEWQRVALVAGLVLALLALSGLTREEGWGPQGTFSATMLGLLFGVGSGFVVEARGVRLAVEGSLRLRFLRAVVGVGGLVALSTLLKSGALALHVTSELAELAVRFGRYGLIGFSLAAGLPWLFVKLRLASQHAVTGA